ncbi:helix-turn-helix domain-containing protein [Clostridium butyricum]|uniref:helix-turn-helix domain-containing protein n=1 Tax=Clostridium TaxID=1485 RepID=UPI001CA9295D|nr:MULTISPECIES: helix-turn-helix transcriptional regulator [Clostridium]MBZ0312295.1 helix-turn-helix domain-containing protein [Clostridium butyricum]UZT05094.1 helix-turn-helix transcriptional regulator [Clostridium sp. LQ25]
MKHIDKINSIAENVKHRRMELKLSYQDLASKTGLSKSTLQRYESGAIKNIPLDKFQLLADALEIDPEILLGLNKENLVSTNRNLTKKEELLLENFNKLNDSGKNKLIEYSNDLNCNIKYICTDKAINAEVFANNFNEIIKIIHNLCNNVDEDTNKSDDKK